MGKVSRKDWPDAGGPFSNEESNDIGLLLLGRVVRKPIKLIQD